MLSLYEVFKRILQRRDEAAALLAVAAMQQGIVVVPTADSIMLATARAHGATLWTQDADFRGMQGVRFVPARP